VSSCGVTATKGFELGLDEGQRLLSVLGAVALVYRLVVARAAVWVGRVAVVLDLGARGVYVP